MFTQPHLCELTTDPELRVKRGNRGYWSKLGDLSMPAGALISGILGSMDR